MYVTYALSYAKWYPMLYKYCLHKSTLNNPGWIHMFLNRFVRLVQPVAHGINFSHHSTLSSQNPTQYLQASWILLRCSSCYSWNSAYLVSHVLAWIQGVSVLLRRAEILHERAKNSDCRMSDVWVLWCWYFLLIAIIANAKGIRIV